MIYLIGFGCFVLGVVVGVLITRYICNAAAEAAILRAFGW